MPFNLDGLSDQYLEQCSGNYLAVVTGFKKWKCVSYGYQTNLVLSFGNPMMENSFQKQIKYKSSSIPYYTTFAKNELLKYG